MVNLGFPEEFVRRPGLTLCRLWDALPRVAGMASLPEKASLEPATAKVNSSCQRSIPVGPPSLAAGERARVRTRAVAEGAGPPGSPPPPRLSSSRRHRRCSSRRCHRRRRRSLDRLLFPWLRPAWQLAGCQARGGGRGRGETGREDGRGGVGNSGRGSPRVTPGPACGPPDPGCRSDGKREFRAAGSRAAAVAPSGNLLATHSEELG